MFQLHSQKKVPILYFYYKGIENYFTDRGCGSCKDVIIINQKIDLTTMGL